jgi:hypothetical protein
MKTKSSQKNVMLNCMPSIDGHGLRLSTEGHMLNPKRFGKEQMLGLTGALVYKNRNNVMLAEDYSTRIKVHLCMKEDQCSIYGPYHLSNREQ